MAPPHILINSGMQKQHMSVCDAKEFSAKLRSAGQNNKMAGKS